MAKLKTATPFQEPTTRQPAAIQEPTHAEIEECAYYRSVERGRLDGFDLDDWLAAEEELHRETEALAVSA